MSEHINEIVNFANTNAEEIWIDCNKLDEKQFLSKWSQFNKGRLYQEFINGIQIIKDWMPLIETANVDASRKKYKEEILSQYKSF